MSKTELAIADFERKAFQDGAQEALDSIKNGFRPGGKSLSTRTEWYRTSLFKVIGTGGSGPRWSFDVEKVEILHATVRDLEPPLIHVLATAEGTIRFKTTRIGETGTFSAGSCAPKEEAASFAFAGAWAVYDCFHRCARIIVGPYPVKDEESYEFRDDKLVLIGSPHVVSHWTTQ